MAEAAGAAGVWRLAKLSADGFAGVLNEEEIVAGGEGLESGHVRGNAEGVNEEDGAGARGDGAFDGHWIEIESDGVDFREDGCGTDLQHGIGYSDESEGRDDDFVAFAYGESQQCEVKAGCAGADGYGVGDCVVGG